MIRSITRKAVVLMVIGLLAAGATAAPLGSYFSYQGKLSDAGVPVNDPAMPMSFNLYDAAGGGNLIAGPLVANVGVVEGLFTAELDFGADAFDGQGRWLEITVDGVTLSPRQEVTAAPYAMHTRGIAVDANGKVGVGTEAPGARFHAAYSPWSEVGVFAGDLQAFGYSAFESNTSAPATHAWFAENGARVFSVTGGGNSYFAGNVGIGADVPGAKLHISGTPGVDGIMFPDGTLQTTASGGANGQMETLELTGGANSYYVLAWGDPESQALIINSIIPMQKVFAGDGYNLGIMDDGDLYYWGDNPNLEGLPCCGPYTQVSGGTYHGLALREDGALADWGQNYFGQLDLPDETYIAVSAGLYHSIGIRSDGTLVGAGLNDEGELENIPSGTFVAVAAGHAHNVAIRTDGTLAAWGANSDGELNVPEGTFIAVSSGSSYSVGIRSDGTLAAWGANYDGQTDVPAGTFTAVSAGWEHVLALRTDGTLAAWGYGVDSYETPSGTFTAIAAASNHNLATPTSVDPPALKLHHDSAFKPGTNTWTISSDSRLKKNIRTMEGSLDKLLQLRGVTFDWRDPAAQGGRTATEMGMIADEVERVFPQWVGRDGRGFRTLTVGGFEGLTAEAMRELRAEKDQQIESLRADNAELRERLSRIENMLQHVED